MITVIGICVDCMSISSSNLRAVISIQIDAKLVLMVKQLKGGDLMFGMSVRAVGSGIQQGQKSNLCFSC